MEKLEKENSLRLKYKNIIEEILKEKFENYKYHYSLYSDYYIIKLPNKKEFIVRLSNHKPFKKESNICWISYNFRAEKVKTKQYLTSKILSHYGFVKKYL